MRDLRPLRPLLCTLLVTACGGSGLPADPPDAGATAFSRESTLPSVIALPDGYWPEGIDFGRGATFYVTSLATGAIWRGDARTGTGDVLVGPQPGVETVGVKYDAAGNRLFVAGGFTGQAFVYDATTGALLAQYALAAPGTSLVNDVVLVRDAAWFTDSYNDVLYRVSLGRAGALPPASAVEVVPLTGDWQSVPSEIGNANGIVATPDGRYLVVVNMSTGLLYRIDAETGHAVAIDLGGGTLDGGDGMLLLGHRLYVVQGPFNSIAEVVLSPDLKSGEIVGTLTSPDLLFPSTIARFGNALYAVNARFDVPPAPDVEYQVVAVSR
jgi:streptogramin lyase